MCPYCLWIQLANKAYYWQTLLSISVQNATTEASACHKPLSDIMVDASIFYIVYDLSVHQSCERLYTSWLDLRSITGLSQGHWQPFTLHFTPITNLESPIRPNMHVFGLWKEAGVPTDNSSRHRENIQTPRRKAPAGRYCLWLKAEVESKTPHSFTLHLQRKGHKQCSVSLWKWDV